MYVLTHWGRVESIGLGCLNANFNNISAILLEDTGVPGKNQLSVDNQPQDKIYYIFSTPTELKKQLKQC